MPLQQEVELIQSDEEDASGVEVPKATPRRRTIYVAVGSVIGLALVAGFFVAASAKKGIMTEGNDLQSDLQKYYQMDFNEAMENVYPDYEWAPQPLGTICKFEDETVVERLTALMTRDCQRNCMDFALKLRAAQPNQGWQCAGVNYNVGYALQCTSYFKPMTTVIQLPSPTYTDPALAANNHGSDWHRCYLLQKK